MTLASSIPGLGKPKRDGVERGEGDQKCLASRQKKITRTSFENSSLYLAYAFLSYAYREAFEACVAT